ncbi:hypothetical protein KZC52_15260 [Microbacterium sp. kSW2-24]|uniref:hypothetical protein n=1 Tax=Microbacterium galbinum TaxID=2851646 RepID=UPI001FFD993C|nr:hypothetical protein [Microbacterium galbinum]MCK2024293.1 hypothetical protein [Microbacterium galbinum]
MPIPRSLSFGLAALVAASAAIVTPQAAVAADAPADQLAVSVVGDGAATGNDAVPVAIQLLDGQGELGDTIALPTTDAGDQHAFTLGANRDQQGALQQSADHRYVTLGGYDAAPGTGSLNDTAAPDTLRVIARIGSEGDVDTATTLAGGFSLRHIRGTATVDGTRYWAGGHGGDSTAPAGGVLTVEAGGTTPTAVVSGSSNLNNGRVVDIHDGQLYLTSDRSGFSGLNTVGTGIPTAAGAPLTLVAAAPAGASVAHDFAFAGEHLYVGYTEGANEGIAKYRRTGATWTWVDTLPGDFWGLEARPAGDDSVLYAVRGLNQGNEIVRILDSGDDSAFTAQTDVLATAAPQTAFRGVAFAPGFEPGTDAVGPILAKPTLSWDVRVPGGAGSALAAVLGQDTNPAATGVIADAAGEAVTATVTSSNPAVVPDEAIRLDVADDGSFRLAATPAATGAAVLTVHLRTDDGRTAISQLPYRVAPAFADDGARGHFGMSDASAAIDAGDGYFFAADDDSNAIRLFSEEGGEAVAAFDFSDRIEFERAGEAHDFEAVARAGDQVFWIGSTGNTRSGNVRLDRDIVLQTQISGSGADATLTFVGYRNVLRDALVAWDHEGQHGLGADRFGFLAATQPGVSAEGPDSLNIEGAAIAPDGTTLWLGFRSPEVGDDADALIVPVADIADVVAGADAVVGDPILLDLGGRAIRDMARAESGDYLIVAGSADDTGRFALFGWSGSLDDAPVAASGTLGLANWPGSYEGIAGVRDLADGTSVRLLLDSGTVDIYGDGTEAQDLSPVEFKLFPSQTVELSFGAAFTEKRIAVTGGTLRIGSPSEITVSGFAEGEQIELVLNSDPVRLAALTAGADGTARAVVVPPASVSPGAHTLTATAASGAAELTVTVLAPVADGGSGDGGSGDGTDGGDSGAGAGSGAGSDAGDALATTGSDFPAGPVALVALALLALGALALRRRGVASE